ncbi:metal-dependent hydrolase [Catenulispora yoronensis]
MVRVFKEALPSVQDEELRATMRGFMGQEGSHAAAHDAFVRQLAADGIDVSGALRWAEWGFRRLLGPGIMPGWRRERWLAERLALVAAIEHVNAVLAERLLDSAELERAGADPTMLALLRWHGAEEIEHRAVADAVYQHIDGSYPRRVAAMAVAVPTFVTHWALCAYGLAAADPVVGRTTGWGKVPGWCEARTTFALADGVRRGLIPTLEVRAMVGYLRPSFRPSDSGSDELARQYLNAVADSFRMPRQAQTAAASSAQAVPCA